jgi:hypothetical protein
MSLIYKAQSRIFVGEKEDSATVGVSGWCPLSSIELLDFFFGTPCSVAKLPVSSTCSWPMTARLSTTWFLGRTEQLNVVSPPRAMRLAEKWSSGLLREASLVGIDCASDTRDGRSCTDCLIFPERHRVALCKIEFTARQ